MMKKFVVLLIAAIIFIACDYATESMELGPDVEVVWMNPIGWYTFKGDTTAYAALDEVHFVPENSIDCYMTKAVWEYYTEGGSRFYGPDEIPLYIKIEGVVDRTCPVCTTKLLNLRLPLNPVVQQLSPGESAEARLYFIFMDEYFEIADTAKAWYGFYMWPDTVGIYDVFNWQQK
jgi:hypothetical protein